MQGIGPICVSAINVDPFSKESSHGLDFAVVSRDPIRIDSKIISSIYIESRIGKHVPE